MKKNIFKIICAAVCLFAVTLFALLEAGITPSFVQTYKNNFKRNISGICNILKIELPIETQLYLDDMSAPTPKPTMTPESQLAYIGGENAPSGNSELTVKEEKQSTGTKPIAFDSAETGKFENYGGNIICVNQESYEAYYPSGKIAWGARLQMQTPILKVNNGYVLISEIGGKKISMYKGKKPIYTQKLENAIISCDLNEKGDVVAVTEREGYKAQVVVLNHSGKKIFVWDSGSYDILDAAISGNRHIALAMLNTDEGADSLITCLDVKGDTKYKTTNYANEVIFDIFYCGERLETVSDSSVMSISKNGKMLSRYSFNEKRLIKYDIAPNGNTGLLFDTDNTGEIIVVSPSGRVKAQLKTETMPDTISIKSRNIAYNNGREAVLTSYKGRGTKRAECGSDIKQMCAMDGNRVLCVYSSSVQIKELKKVKKHTERPTATEKPENQEVG